MKIRWIKKLFSTSEWKDYGGNPAYCFLAKNKDGVWAGFSIVQNDGREHKDCFDLTLEEMRQVDDYRKGNRIFPRPFEDRESIGERISKNRIGRVIDETREMLNEAGILRR